MSSLQSPSSIQDLKQLFADHLCDANRLRPADGLPTGFEALDRFLLWGGIPKGALTLFGGLLGTGATSLWIDIAASVVRDGKWVAWINRDVELFPMPLHHKGMNLEKVVAIEAPDSDDKLFWLLQELMSSELFEMIGCDLGERFLKEHQLRKLQTRARDSHIALVFLSQNFVSRALSAALLKNKPRAPRLPRGSIASVYSLILSFEKKSIVVERALHRPTPHNISWSLGSSASSFSSVSRSSPYARFTVHTTDRIGLGAQHSTSERSPSREPHSLPEAAKPASVGV